MPQHKQGKKHRKVGRNKDKCALYKTARSHRNKLAKLKTHLKHHPSDGCAVAALERAR